ncbi:MAG: UDP-N-acetylmuramoyl-tripeptide--D-alanyl-D-alanine ligase [Gillisia sp.]
MKIEKLHQLFLESAGVTTDSRNILDGGIFFALKGDNFNGNAFASKALEKGAKYAVIDEKEYAENEDCILVKDSLKALQKLANFHKHYLNIPILAITGSNGKTTSKELISAVLSQKFTTVATKGNLNNHIGVPLTLLSMNETTEMGVVEMGANHHGEIKKLCKIAHPDYGYITNFGKAHLEGFGSVEGVIKAKSELYNFLKKNNKLLFLNADDPIQQKNLRYSPHFSFGKDKEADVQISYREISLLAEISEGETIYKSQLMGSYNAINMAAAVCIGKYFRIQDSKIQEAIQSYSPKNNRSQLLQLEDMSLLMDAYNANPTSMRAALENFSSYPHEKKIAILGDMFELGSNSAQEHQDIITLLENSSIEKAFVTGSNFNKVILSNPKIEKFEKFEDLQQVLSETDLKGAFILIKGSRKMALERLIDLFKKTYE